MKLRKFTVVAQLHKEQNYDLIEYVESCFATYNKAKTVSSDDKGKKYNDMLHSLSYSKFVCIMENVCYRNYVWLRKVNPAWTSWIAKQKYCPKMKLNVHTGASFVIARRCQGYTDRV